MKKAFSRAYVDLSISEAFKSFGCLFIEKSLDSYQTIHEFEKRFSEYIGTRYAVTFPSCRSAIFFSLKALKLSPDNEVILPAYTFWVDAAMVLLADLKPVFVDVELETSNINPKLIEKAITDKTRVILPVHLNGLPADMKEICDLAAKYKLRIIEDCARSCGAKYQKQQVGSFDIGTFSFGYGKNFFTYGGGMVTTNDYDVFIILQELKKKFSAPDFSLSLKQIIKGSVLSWMNNKYIYPYTLFNLARAYHLSGMKKFNSLFQYKIINYQKDSRSLFQQFNYFQAKLGLSQLNKIDKSNQLRIKNLFFLNKLLADIPQIKIPPVKTDQDHICVHYAIRAYKKNKLMSYLLKNGIDVQDESAMDTTQLLFFKKFACLQYPVSQKLHNQVFFLPALPDLTKNEVSFIAQKIREFYDNFLHFNNKHYI